MIQILGDFIGFLLLHPLVALIFLVLSFALVAFFSLLGGVLWKKKLN